MSRPLATILYFLFALTPGWAQQKDTISLIFIGDVMAHSRQLEYALRADGDSLNWEDYDFSSYFSHVRPLFDSADFVCANMESAFGITPYTGYPAFSTPKSLAIEAQKSGINLFLCANNHITDKGARGLDSTYSIYSDLGVLFTGFGRDKDGAASDTALTVDICGFKTAFINFTYDVNGHKIPAGYHVNTMDTTFVKDAISKARTQGADYIVVLPHWGIEYELDCNSSQQRWVSDIIRWGGDAIVGSHPHVVQKSTFNDGHPVAYSLGNYISNMSIVTSQIGMIYRFSLTRLEDRSVRALQPEVIYTWCGRGGMMEDNYTVVPIKDYIDKPDAFIDSEQYRKMMDDWSVIKEKFNL